MLNVEFLGMSVNEKEKSLIPRVKLKLRIYNWSEVGIYILSCDSGILVNGHYAGKASRLRLGLYLKPNEHKDFSLLWEIPYDVLERIERLRNGKRLQIMIDVVILAYIFGQTNKVSTFISNMKNSGFYYSYCPIDRDKGFLKFSCVAIDPKTKSPEIIIPIDDWVDILAKLNFKRVRIVEVPAINEDPSLDTVVEELEKAWRLASQNFEESLNACRKALESLKNYVKGLGFIKKVKDEKSGKEIEKIDFKEIYGGDSVGKAMDSIFTGLWQLTNVGSHAGRSKLIKQADMEFVITSIYMLLKSMIENMRNKC